MDNDNKLLVLAALIVVVLGFLGFLFGDLTGFAARDRDKVLTRLYLSSDSDIIEEFNPVLGPGSFLYLTIEVGSGGITDRVSFYEQIGLNPRRRDQTHLGCTGYICRQYDLVVKKYKILNSWDGEYCASIYDRDFREDVQSCFFVSSS